MSDIHFDIKPDAQTERTFRLVASSGLRAKRAIRQTFYCMGKALRPVTQNMLAKGPRSGRIYKYKGRRFQASAPGEPPQRISGRLRRSVNFSVHGAHYLEFGATADYAGYLEDGTKKMKPRPYLKPTIEKTKGIGERIGRREFEKEFNKP